jgi:hypothetical protein
MGQGGTGLGLNKVNSERKKLLVGEMGLLHVAHTCYRLQSASRVCQQFTTFRSQLSPSLDAAL